MKKVFFGFVALSLIMLTTSCNNETVEVNPDLGNMLTFKAATGKQTLTRATEVNLGTLKSEGVKVYSYRATDNFFYKDYDLSFVTDSWKYGSAPEYHPLTYSLKHYSVYPSDVAVSIFEGKTSAPVSFEFIVKDDYAEQVDLMVADDITTPTDGTANLTYKHILSQVNFAIQGMENLIVEISKIKLTNINSTSTYTFGTGWGSRTAFVDYDYNPAVMTSTLGLDDYEIIYLGNTGDGASSIDNTTNNALMLLPQTLDPTAKLTFSYKLYNKATPPVEFDSDAVTVTLDQLGVTEWLEGKRYLYKLIFDPVLLEFEVDVVEDWIDYDNADGIIDVETEDYD